MSILDPRLWLALVLALAAAFGTGYWKGDTHATKRAELDRLKSVASANAEALRLERARQSRADDAGRLAAAREAGIRAGADRVRGELGGLQRDLDAARLRGAQSLEASRQHSATLETVFGQCVRRLEEVARDADGHASDSLKFQQAWPTDKP